MAQINVVPFIPGSAITSAYDNEPVAYGQAGLPNIIDPTETAYKNCCIGEYIYRSVGDDYQTKVPYSDHIKGFTELNFGAHYYVMSGYSDQHSKASARVHISELSCKIAGNRTGYISLSIVSGGTVMKQCDIGLAYRNGPDGEGWYPSSWAKNWKASSGGLIPYVVPKNFYVQGYDATTMLDTDDIAEIEIEAFRFASSEHVIGTIYKVGADDTKTVFAQVKYRAVTKGSYFAADHDKAYIRFTRFMSLVPNNDNCTSNVECTDYADQSMLRGVMRDCKIDGQPWDSSKIAFAWSVQTANIRTLKIGQLTTPSIGSDADECYIVHDTETHGTPTKKEI